MTDHQLVRDCFIRVCRDSKFMIGPLMAAELTASMVKTHPLLVWTAFPSFSVMEDIADGTHPILLQHRGTHHD